MSTKKYTKEQLKKMKDLTDYERMENMTDEEIQKGAEGDSDAPPTSDEDLKRFKKRTPKKRESQDEKK